MAMSKAEVRMLTLIDLGAWAIATGRGWLVKAVEIAVQREGLRHD
jgi:hypothetical protein